MITVAERNSDLRFTTHTSYLALTGELSGVFCEDLGENWLRYNGIALYLICFIDYKNTLKKHPE